MNPMMKQNKIFIGSLSSFIEVDNKSQVSAAEQLEGLFTNYGISVLKNNAINGNKKTDFFRTLFLALKNMNKLTIAILPLFGTRNSILWYRILASLFGLCNKKIVCVVRGGSIPQQLEKGETKFDEIFKKADAIVTPSRFIQQSLLKKNIEAVVIKNPIPISRYSFSKKEKARPHILWMRSFHETYNPLMAVRVASILAKKYDDFKMVMAGNDRGMIADTKSLAKKLNLENKILFPGYIDLQQKETLADEYDIFISTNKIDNAPVSVIEFMALGLPVVAVNKGGIPFIVDDGQNGLLVNDDDDVQMADKISSLIENSSLYTAIRNYARQYAMQYDEDVIMKKWEELFDKLA